MPPKPPEQPDASGALSDDAWLTRVADGLARLEGAPFFEALVETLARTLEVEYVLIVERAGARELRALAFHAPGGTQARESWPLAGSAFEACAGAAPLALEQGARHEFPGDALLSSNAIEGWIGMELRGPGGETLGGLAVFDTRPIEASARELAIVRIFAARAAAELARLHVERSFSESEERFRDLFDEAPIAYVHEDLESRFLRANRAALRILGLKPEESVGTVGISLVADTPEAKRQVQLAFESVGRGTDTSGVVLHMRRKSDGQPVYIQWWSRPDPGGTYTRTMFIDITDRVLMEQEQARLKEQNRYLREEIQSVHNFEEIVGRSAHLASVLADVDRVAQTDASVLITGETGTGKELIARAIHSTSKRRDKPLIKLNCAALPTGLVESELFGHEKGAFSGAIARRIGRFELAQGGTIFLDEIGEVPPDVQVRLLRVLQEREFERVGGNQTIQVDVRIIAATNRDLERAIAQDKFRQDLYYRLNVYPIHLPPLRDRAEDIPLLVSFFLKKFAARTGKRVDDITPELARRFSSYAWPGNVRELENILERAVILARGDTLDVDCTPLLAAAPAARPVAALQSDPGPARSAGTPNPPPAAGASLEAIEREHIRATLEQTGWVIDGPSGAARKLELHPNPLRSRMKKLGITRAPRAT